MSKILISFGAAFTVSILLAYSFVSDDEGISEPAADVASGQTTAAPEAIADEHTEPAGDLQGSVMDQPVNFSTPEDVEKTLQNVREQAGDSEARDLNNALQYLQMYDLSVAGSKEKLLKKLDRKTPNEIIAKMQR